MASEFSNNRSLSSEARLRALEDYLSDAFRLDTAASEQASTLGGGTAAVVAAGGGGGGGGSTTLLGDVTGPATANTVEKVRNQDVTAGSISDQFWVFTGTVWVPRKFIAALGVGTGADPVPLLDIGASVAGRAPARIPAGTAPTTPNEGEWWNDSARKAWVSRIDGVNQTWLGVIFAATANGQVANTTTETTLIGSGVGTLTLPANFLVAGKTIRLTAAGIFSTQLVPVALNIRFKLGSTVIIATGAQVPSGATTNRFWWVEVLLTCRTTGVTGTVIAQGSFFHGEATGLTAFSWEMVNVSVITLDTTASQIVDLSAQWNAGVAAADDIRSTNVAAEILS